ncbi:tetratricopeptide repeat protein [Blastopirellula marina]|uniref:GlcNAc transferase n=1 Tax=Blastopirellula marina TaxID=124 RepID=A0A2S8GDS7_9BACT|nr:tetratricopeptide repeat protein [Blastopirellula marina]PQO42618.1 hypothetical protein C5Y98_01920 [Blastopirellula marina]PTL46384.1 tetratricopeptide repeat protein [Blastopirellula marina]
MRKTIAKRVLKTCARELFCAGLAVQALVIAPTLGLGAERPKPIHQVSRISSESSSESKFRLVQFAGEGESSGNSITSAFKKAGSSISGFFTPAPEPVHAAHEPKVADDDPISLSNMPDKVNVEVYMNAARMMENSGNFEAAERQYKTCLEKFPKHRVALISYGRLLHRSNRLDEALSMYEKAAKYHPKDAVICNDLGLCYARMGRRDEAMEQFHQATVIAPEDPRYRNNLAMILVDAGRNDEALSQLVYAHGKAKGLYNLGFLLYRNGDKTAASSAFQTALAADATLKPAEEMLRRIQSELPSEPQMAPPQGNAMFISDQPRNNPVRSMNSPSESTKIPPAPELEPPRLLPPVN